MSGDYSVAEIDNGNDPRQLEHYKHTLAKELENHKAELNRSFEKRRLENEKLMGVWRALFEYAQIGIRTVILSNTAAATAILAFLGNALKTNTSSSPGTSSLPETVTSHLGLAVFVFALGVAAGFVATIFAYQSQFQLGRVAIKTGQDIVPGTRWERVAGMASVIVGLCAFLIGVGLAARAFSAS
jgi:hypothetical protein